VQRFLVQRVLLLAPTLFLASLLVFGIIQLAPGDPARMRLGTEATADEVAAERARLGLDQPVPVRYVIWLSDVAHRNLGKSQVNGRPVVDLVLEAFPNTLRLALHPQGMAPRILNLGAWRAHLLHRLERHVEASGDEALRGLYKELLAYPGPDPADHAPDAGEIMVELRLATDDGELTFFSTITTFGTAVDITVSEISIEAFFPADASTAQTLGAAMAVS